MGAQQARAWHAPMASGKKRSRTYAPGVSRCPRPAPEPRHTSVHRPASPRPPTREHSRALGRSGRAALRRGGGCRAVGRAREERRKGTRRVQLVRRDGRDVSTLYGREGGGGGAPSRACRARSLPGCAGPAAEGSPRLRGRRGAGSQANPPLPVSVCLPACLPVCLSLSPPSLFPSLVQGSGAGSGAAPGHLSSTRGSPV